MKTGKVAVFTQPQTPMEFREYPIPSVTADDILVRIGMANICGSDLHFWRGHGPKIEEGIPQVLGHEMIGTIEAMGRNITSIAWGNHSLKETASPTPITSRANTVGCASTGNPGVRIATGIGLASPVSSHRTSTVLTANTTI